MEGCQRGGVVADMLELKNMKVNLRVELWRDPLIESTG